jgi:hypothetical protein
MHAISRQRRQISLFIRRFFIIIYFTVSFFHNETSYLETFGGPFSQSVKNKKRTLWTRDNDTINEGDIKNSVFISLGYMTILSYDLIRNFEYIRMRSMLALHWIYRLCTQNGLNNLVSHNWFQRLRVPLMLRLYFLIKCVSFTVCFIIFYDFYIHLNHFFVHQIPDKQTSIYFVVDDWLTKLKEIIYYNQINENETSDTLAISDDFNNKEMQFLKAQPSILKSYSHLFEYIYPLTHLFNHHRRLNFSSTSTTTSDEQWDVDFDSYEFFDITIVYFKILLLNLTSTWLSIACTTSIISYQFKIIGYFVEYLTRPSSPSKTIINLNQNSGVDIAAVQQAEDDALNNDTELINVGDVSAILFFLLSIQSGLTSLTGQSRIEKFLKNYSLLFIAILHYFHTTLDTMLNNLSASSKADFRSERHVRVLSVSCALILICIGILLCLILNFNVSTWLLAACAFNIELIIKMTVSLVVYIISIIDAKKNSYEILKNDKNNLQTDSNNNKTFNNIDKSELNFIERFPDNLDDYIYYVKAFGHSFEFIVAIFLFFNGAYILLFESYG